MSTPHQYCENCISELINWSEALFKHCNIHLYQNNMTHDSYMSLTMSQKTNFHAVYNQLDPRAYYAALAPFAYQTPQNVSSLISRLIQASGCGEGSGRSILDVCCSYGINSALLRRNLTYDDLARHYAASKLPSAEQVVADRLFFDAHTRSSAATILGLDTATNAIRYATTAGLIANGWDENLEEGAPSAGLCQALRNVGLIICSRCRRPRSGTGPDRSGGGWLVLHGVLLVEVCR